MYALNTANGDIRWTYTTSKAIYSGPGVVDGVVYVGSENGTVYALNATL